MNDFNTSNVTVIRDRTTEKPAGRQYFNTSNVTVIRDNRSMTVDRANDFNTSNVTVIQGQPRVDHLPDEFQYI